MGRSGRSHVSTPVPQSPGVHSLFDRGNHRPLSPSSCTSHGSIVLPWLEGCPPAEAHGNGWMHQEMSLDLVVEFLRENGCTDLTDELDLSRSQEVPWKSGSFGNVYRGTLRDGRQVALKCLQPVIHQTPAGYQILKAASRELDAWSRCKHSNILQLLGVAQYRKQFAIVSPWMANGTLNRFLSMNHLVPTDRYKLCYQVAESVTCLHQMGLAHGDIKAANIMVSADRRAVLSEFGNTVIRENSVQWLNSTEGIDVSVRWMAPELLEEPGTPTIESDVYALGMTFLEVVTGSEPYSGLKTLAVWQNVMSRELPERPERYIPTGEAQADLLWSLLNECWAHDPRHRPTAAQVQCKMRNIKGG